MNKIKIIVFIILFALGLMLVGCEKKETAKTVETKITVNDIFVDDEQCVLLSKKYGVNEERVSKIITEYEASSLNFLTDSSKSKEMDRIKALIAKLHVKYKIPEKKIASLLIDYKIWESYVPGGLE